ncbi:TorD/DmsD family molecular chaperone [Paraferrimonas sedimenticola]|uniref:Molecular chaperone TorD n=1 Tax=Paraferrimonas sedimenticola TaxID=375674 RepID=A0AA37RXA4_9GAMM|nr:molecular chaperone TorD family protein [Paraferrimonas sedimenticola]GLP97069.1 molecular chaperone TorD [Paraferrimonas sedimenticola]
MTDSNNFDYCAAQGAARVLHNVFLYYPELSFVETLKQNQAAQNWPDLSGSNEYQQGVALLGSFLEQWDESQLQQLKIEYGYSFFTPGEPKVMPWGSLYLGEQQMLNDTSTLELESFYRQYQVEFDLSFNQPADHIALFFAVIDQLLGELGRDPENKMAADALTILLQQHLMPWVHRFFEGIQEHCDSDYYKGMGFLGSDLLSTLSNHLQVVPWKKLLYR